MAEQSHDASSTIEILTVEQAFETTPDWEQMVEAMHGSEPLLKDVLKMLASEVPRLAKTFRKELEAGHFKDAQRAVHTFKSNVRHVGMEQVAAYAQRLENLARDGKQSELNRHVDPLERLAEAIANWSDALIAERQ